MGFVASFSFKEVPIEEIVQLGSFLSCVLKILSACLFDFHFSSGNRATWFGILCMYIYME